MTKEKKLGDKQGNRQGEMSVIFLTKDCISKSSVPCADRQIIHMNKELRTSVDSHREEKMLAGEKK